MKRKKNIDEYIIHFVKHIKTITQKQYSAFLLHLSFSIPPDANKKTKLKIAKNIIPLYFNTSIIAILRPFIVDFLYTYYTHIQTTKFSIQKIEKSDTSFFPKNLDPSQFQAFISAMEKYLLQYYSQKGEYNIIKQIIKDLEEWFIDGKQDINKILQKLKTQYSNIDKSLTRSVEILVDNFTTKIFHYSKIFSMKQAGIEYIRIIAVLDKRTTTICRHMHNRIIPLSDAQNQATKTISAMADGNLEKAHSYHMLLAGNKPFSQYPKTTKECIQKGIIIPPYHFRCRTTFVADFTKDNIQIKNGKNATPIGLTKTEITANLLQIKNLIENNTIKFPRLDSHTKKHASEFSANTSEEYLKKILDILKNPDNIFLIEKYSDMYSIKKRGRFLDTLFLFVKNNKIVSIGKDLMIHTAHTNPKLVNLLNQIGYKIEGD